MRVSRSVWRAALVALVWPSALAGADGSLTASFRIDSVFFTDVYPAAVRSDVEARVAGELAGVAKSHFGFLDWRAGRAQAGPTLILKMVDVTGGACNDPPAVKLKWAAVLEGRERDLASVVQHDLYRPCDPEAPAQEPDRLVTDVVAALTALLANEATRQRIAEQVLASVPIASSLVPHANQMLLLPVHPARLLADPTSQLVARFDLVTAQPAVPGDITLRPNSPFDDQIQLLILAINAPSLTADLPPQGALWHDALTEILAGSSNLRVFMIQYVPNPFAGETVGGVLSDL